jgi:hypothetical protein
MGTVSGRVSGTSSFGMFSAPSRAEDRLFDRERPIEVLRVDRDLERAWILGRVSRALSRTLCVNSLLEITSADGALKNQPEGSGPLRGLVIRAPAHPQRAGQPNERFGLRVPMSGPLAEILHAANGAG